MREKQISAESVPFFDVLNPKNVRTGFVDEEVFWKLFGALPAEEPYRDVALFAYRSGWRRNEVESLTWGQIDLVAREARLWDSKNGHGRVLPLESELWEVIERRQAARRFEGPSGAALSPFVFHRGGEAIGEWRKTWARASRAAGVPGLLFHDFRRSAIRNMTRAGVPAVIAMTITGHRTRAVFDRYDIATTNEGREAIRSTVSYLRGEEPRTATEQLRFEPTGRKV